MRPRFLGAENAETDRRASPLSYVTADAPPFLLAYGTEDFPHLRDQADTIETALARDGCDVAKIVFDGRDHFGASLAGGEPDGPWVSRALDWMAAH